MQAHVLQPGALPDFRPMVLQVRHGLPTPRARDDIGVAVRPRDPLQQLDGRRRQLHRPGSRLGVGEPHLAGLQVDMVPVQVDDLVLAAAGQKQQPHRHRGVHPGASLLLGLVQRPSETLELLVGQEALVAARPIHRDLAARVAALRDRLPLLGGAIDPEQHLDRLVGRRGRLAQRMMERRHRRMIDRQRRLPPERRQDVVVDRAAVGLRRSRLQAHLDHLLEIGLHQLAHRRPFRQRHRLRLGDGLLAGLDPGDDLRRPAARLLRRDDPDAPDRHANGVRAAGACLHHIVLASARIDAHPEPLELAVPEHRVPVGLQPPDRAARDRRPPELRHRPSPRLSPYAARSSPPDRRSLPMLSPTLATDAFSLSSARCA